MQLRQYSGRNTGSLRYVSIPDMCKRDFWCLNGPGWLWDPHSSIFGGIAVLCPVIKVLGLKLTTHPHFVQRLKMSGAVPPVLCVPSCRYAYLLTPWSRVLLEKLTGFAANQKFPSFYGTRKFITVLTSARHLFLS